MGFSVCFAVDELRLLFTNHSSVLWICCRALVKASAFSRDGNISLCEPIDGKCFFEKRFRWKLCFTVITCVWFSAMFRNPSIHSCRARALTARNFNVSPDVQLIVNVRESSSLGQITAPAKYSWVEWRHSLTKLFQWWVNECFTTWLPDRKN